MGQLAVYDMLYPSLYTFSIHLYTKNHTMRHFTNLTVVLIKITNQMMISVFRGVEQEALSDVKF